MPLSTVPATLSATSRRASVTSREAKSGCFDRDGRTSPFLIVCVSRSTRSWYLKDARWQTVHGNAAYFFNGATNRAVGQTRTLAAETINQALASAGKTTASVQWYMVQNHGTAYGDPEHLYIQPGGP
jgi:hypothetical protein